MYRNIFLLSVCQALIMAGSRRHNGQGLKRSGIGVTGCMDWLLNGSDTAMLSMTDSQFPGQHGQRKQDGCRNHD